MALEGALRPRSLVPPRGRRRPIVRLLYATGISTVNPGLLGSSFGHGSLVFLGLSEQVPTDTEAVPTGNNYVRRLGWDTERERHLLGP